MLNWKPEDDAFILQCVKEEDSVSNALHESAKYLNRPYTSIHNRYYNHLRKSKVKRQDRSKCIVFDKESVNSVEKRYNSNENVTIIILHINGKS